MMKHTKHLLVLWAALLLGAGNAWGEGSETFENVANATSYGTRTWTGDNGLQWTATSFRTDQKITGSRGLTAKSGTACTITMPLTTEQQNSGMGTFTFKYKYPYSDRGKSNNLSFTISGTTYTGTVSYPSNTTTVTTVDIIVNQSTLPSTITITIASGGRACFDDFSWTSYSGSTGTTLYLGLFLAAFVAVRACVRRVECLYATFHHIIMSKIDFGVFNSTKDCVVFVFFWNPARHVAVLEPFVASRHFP